ncbi:MAG: epoxyqueuosine reductase QueH, partial [Candidatus Geothermincolia bacterium]
MFLAVHACCAPCTLGSLPCLPDGRALFLYDNPNIHPFREYRSRRDSFIELAQAERLDFEVLPYRPEDWIRAVAAGSRRCEACYRLRLDAVARYAAERGCSALTTTLLASPYQDHDLLNHTGQAAATANGLE